MNAALFLTQTPVFLPLIFPKNLTLLMSLHMVLTVQEKELISLLLGLLQKNLHLRLRRGGLSIPTLQMVSIFYIHNYSYWSFENFFDGLIISYFFLFLYKRPLQKVWALKRRQILKLVLVIVQMWCILQMILHTLVKKCRYWIYFGLFLVRFDKIVNEKSRVGGEVEIDLFYFILLSFACFLLM